MQMLHQPYIKIKSESVFRLPLGAPKTDKNDDLDPIVWFDIRDLGTSLTEIGIILSLY